MSGPAPTPEAPQLRPRLTFFDLTNITVGSIVGADIYVASAITAGILGPASLVAWVVAGMLAATLALVLASCAGFVPRVGGPYAYVAAAFGPFPGFVAGWAMWAAEVIALPVFAISFTNYLAYFGDLGEPAQIAVRGGFLALLTGVNVAGVKAAGRLNDVLTIAKLTPLLLLVVIGGGYLATHAEVARAHYLPFAPHGIEGFRAALLLIFWAYAGFELTTIPAAEVQEPRRTIPRALITGMAIVTLFYLATNAVVYGMVPWQELSQTSTPLILVGTALVGGVGAWVMAGGALISVSGSDESDMLASARRSYAMALDGLLPRPLARLHPRFETPHVALILQGIVAFGLSMSSRIPHLITFAVFNLSLTFLLSSLALWRLSRDEHDGFRQPLAPVLAVVGVAITVFLIASSKPLDILVGLGVTGAGVLVYAAFAPRRPHEDVAVLESPALLVHHATARQERFLGHWLLLIRGALRRVRGG